jgi:hypothetical protein
MIAMAMLAAAVAADLEPLAAAHHGEVAGGEIRWRTTLVVGRPEGGARIALLLPLPAEAFAAEDNPGARPLLDAKGDIVAFDLSLGAFSWPVMREGRFVREATLTTRQPFVDGRLQARIPLAAGPVPHRITFSGPGEPRFVPDAGTGIEAHMSHFDTPDLRGGGRKRCDALLGSKGKSGAIYFTASPRLAGGITGKLTTAATRSGPVVVFALAGTAVLIAALAFAYRLLERRAIVERALAFLGEKDAPWSR